MKSRFLETLCGTVFICFASQIQAIPLEPRLGGEAYYDPNLNITWAADIEIFGTNYWTEQVDWVAGLTIGGINGWRLPNADVNGDGIVIDCSLGGVDCVDNEIGYLFWEEGINASSPGPFNSVPSDSFYWTSTQFAPLLDPDVVVQFDFNSGVQGTTFESFASNYAWAVRSGDVLAVPIGSGDVLAVPIPATVWLIGSGLVGLGVARKRRR